MSALFYAASKERGKRQNREEISMPYYETVFIARQELSDAQVKSLTEDYAKIIKDGGGTVHKTENWGLRTLAYRIRKNRKGHYVLIETDTPPAALHELERQMRLSDDVLRFMSVSREELSKGPSAILNKDRDDDERGDRGYGRDRGDRDRGDRDRGDRDRSDRNRDRDRDDKEAA
jgi:small subunit ribosomal protein S6